MEAESSGGEEPDSDAEEQGEIDAEGARACALLGELLERFGREYAALKAARGALDFDDLELGAWALLEEHERVRKRWAERFELMMVDEFQDTNPRQLAILGALERENLFTVGDALQSIYGFRHADVSLFRARRDELAERGGSLSLTRNFRGRKPLLDVVNAVFEERFAGGDYTALEAGRVEEPASAGAETEAEAEGGGAARGAAADPQARLGRGRGARGGDRRRAAIRAALAPGRSEAAGPARGRAGGRAGQRGRGRWRCCCAPSATWRCTSVRFRTAAWSTLATVGGFWEGEQVGDLLAYLRTLANPLDELALYGTLASPLVGVSSDALALLGRAAKASKAQRLGDARAWRGGAYGDGSAGRRSRAAGGVPRASARRARRRGAADDLPADRARARSERLRRARAHAERRERRLANVHKLLRVARRYEASEGRESARLPRPRRPPPGRAQRRRARRARRRRRDRRGAADEHPRGEGPGVRRGLRRRPRPRAEPRRGRPARRR